MADLSSDADLRAYLRAELGLTDSSRVPDEDIDAEIQAAKEHISKEVAYKVDSGESLNFYGPQTTAALVNYIKVRLAPVSPNTSVGGENVGDQTSDDGWGVSLPGRGPPDHVLDKIPADHPRSISHVRRTDFGDEKVNFWRDRMVRAFNRI